MSIESLSLTEIEEALANSGYMTDNGELIDATFVESYRKHAFGYSSPHIMYVYRVHFVDSETDSGEGLLYVTCASNGELRAEF